MKNLLFWRQSNILSAASVLAGAILLAKALGIIRFWLLTIYVHPVSDLDLFFAAFRLPDFIFQILIIGAVSTAFIPTITQLISKGHIELAWKTASTVINITMITFSFLSLAVILFTPQLLLFIAPGLTTTPEKSSSIILLTRIMFVGQLFFALSIFSSALIQSTKRFLVPALAPMAYNLGIILGTVCLYPIFGLVGLAYGVVAGTILHLLIQVPLVHHLGFIYQPIIDAKLPPVREISKMFVPRTLGLAVSQLSFTVDTALASLLSSTSVTILNLSQALQQVPIGLFGATIAQAALPTLSEEQAKESPANFVRTLLNSFHQILFLTMPVAVIFIILRIPIVRLAFGLGNTNLPWATTVLTAKTLAFFSLGIVAQSLTNLLIRAFYALKDSVTVVKISAAGFIISIGASLFFVLGLGFPIWALAASSATGDIITFGFLLLFLSKLLSFNPKDLFLPAVKILIAGAVTGLALYIPLKLLDQLVFDTTKTIPLLVLTGSVSSLGLSVYLFLAWLLDIKELESFIGLIRQIKKIKQIWTTPTEVVETVETHG